jgi:hypothetical protein
MSGSPAGILPNRADVQAASHAETQEGHQCCKANKDPLAEIEVKMIGEGNYSIE